jgi:hypothetical protein
VGHVWRRLETRRDGTSLILVEEVMANSVVDVNLGQVARELSSSLELALVANAPNALVEQLSAAAGLAAALSKMRLDTPALRIRARDAIVRAERARRAFRTWTDATKAVA